MKKILFGILLGISSIVGSLQAANDSVVLKTIQGKELHIKGIENGLEISEYKGRVVFLEFWGTHCPPCLISVPNYIELKKKFGNKLAIVAIEVQDTPITQLKAFAKNKGINYDVIDYRTAQATGFVDYMAQRTGWKGSIPFLVIFDKAGKAVTMQTGLLNEKALAGLVQELVKVSNTASAPVSQSKEPEKK